MFIGRPLQQRTGYLVHINPARAYTLLRPRIDNAVSNIPGSQVRTLTKKWNKMELHRPIHYFGISGISGQIAQLRKRIKEVWAPMIKSYIYILSVLCRSNEANPRILTWKIQQRPKKLGFAEIRQVALDYHQILNESYATGDQFMLSQICTADLSKNLAKGIEDVKQNKYIQTWARDKVIGRPKIMQFVFSNFPVPGSYPEYQILSQATVEIKSKQTLRIYEKENLIEERNIEATEYVVMQRRQWQNDKWFLCGTVKSEDI